MTSYDRHASHDSPYRATGSGQGIGRNPGLHGVRTSFYQDDPIHPAARSTTALAGGIYSPPSAVSTGSLNGSPTQTYTPGARSLSVANMSGDSAVPLQDFGSDGLPPPPPVAHSWARIERWTDANYPELKDQLCEGATVNDINELEFDLDCSLPQDVRESIQLHDGQERGGMPTGIIFSAMLLDCEEILYEWKNWKTVNQEFLANSESKSKAAILARQDSSPDGAVQKAYCHPGWIPLARDWGGNNIAVDLAPGPTGKWGQIILCGRDYDCKYVVARSWAAFLAQVADDMESPHWYVDEETNELKLKDPRAPRREPSYFDILRVRNMQKYKRLPRKQQQPNGQGSAPGSPSSSNSGQERGRKQSGGSRHSSPGTSLQPPKSRLSRVTEEIPALPVPAHTKLDATKGKENGSTEPLNILDESIPIDKTAAAIKGLEEVSLDSKAEKAEGTDNSEISRPPLAANRRSVET
ncbi:hypothetical protein BDZ91DRAFT_435737 [Kalaharituber pfeilii]|nr:hypothetical protein BDZ91DRAFT_435737 [Kalaharituber pfeilii]